MSEHPWSQASACDGKTAKFIKRRAAAVEFSSFPRRLCASQRKNGGVLVSTDGLKHRRHVEDGSLASLITEPKQINADHQDLALAA